MATMTTADDQASFQREVLDSTVPVVVWIAARAEQAKSSPSRRSVPALATPSSPSSASPASQW